MTALSRRDRAAMVLALECLRWWPEPRRAEQYAVPSAADALRKGEDASGDLDCALMDAEDERVPPRLLRARLALALRVLLRADAGDYGPWYCSRGHEWPKRHCDAPDGGPGPGWCFYDVHPGEKAHAARGNRRIRPLWERAPAHDGTTPAMRRAR